MHGLAPEHVLRGGGDAPHHDPFFDLAAVQQALARVRVRVRVRVQGEPLH